MCEAVENFTPKNENQYFRQLSPNNWEICTDNPTFSKRVESSEGHNDSHFCGANLGNSNNFGVFSKHLRHRKQNVTVGNLERNLVQFDP